MDIASILGGNAGGGLGPQGSTGASNLGQADFLRLLTEQLKNQDPLKPLDSNQFLGQLAQFSTVQGIQGLQGSFNSLAAGLESEQALQATSLIGHDVLVYADRFQLASGGSMTGSLDVPQSGQVTIEITNAGGEVVRRVTTTANAGTMPLSWDGITDAGEAAPPGEYRISARVGNGDSTQALPPQIAARIDSVSFTAQGLLLNVGGIGQVPFSTVRRIG